MQTVHTHFEKGQPRRLDLTERRRRRPRTAWRSRHHPELPVDGARSVAGVPLAPTKRGAV
jgi:hypothetical protein